MVLQNASLLSSAMPKLYLCSKCSAELQSRMYCTFFHMKAQEMAPLCKSKNYVYSPCDHLELYLCVQTERVLSGHMQVSLV